MSLVNVIAPCYNGAKYLDRFFLSLLNQTFKDFDIFFVDDGSTDNTKQIVADYIKKFKVQGINLNYFYKENGGAASAVNVALKQNLTGKYLLILDSDDEVTPEHMELKVKFMEENPNYGAVGSYYEFIDNETNKFMFIHKQKGIKKHKLTTFKNILLANNICFPGYLFDKQKLFSVLDDNQIFESHGGQNWQLLLPIAYNFPIGVIKKPLYRYFIIQSSHSHIAGKTKEDYEKRILLHEEILIETLKRTNVENDIYKYVDKYKLSNFINLAYKFKDKEMMLKNYHKYTQLGFFNLKLFIKYLLIKIGLIK